MNNSVVTVRFASVDDNDQICEIYNHYVRNTIVTFDVEEKSNSAYRLEMQAVLRRFPYFVAECEGSVVGYAYAGPWKSRCAYDYTVESSVYLDAEYTGLGIGKLLYHALINALSEMKIHSVIAGISLPNEHSVQFHERFGFTKIAQFREVGYKFNRWIDVGYWELLLPYQPEN